MNSSFFQYRYTPLALYGACVKQFRFFLELISGINQKSETRLTLWKNCSNFSNFEHKHEDERADRRMDRWKNVQLDKGTDGQMDICAAGQRDRWTIAEFRTD